MTRIAILASAPILAATLLLALSLTRRSDPPPPPPDQRISCAMEAATDPELAPMPPQEPYEPTPVVEPAKPLPGPDIYAHLEPCLQDLERVWGQKMAPITVAQVRYWVEVEKDPVWLEGGSWWLPLSGEGTPNFPSGIYISVPMQGGTCGGAIVN